MPTTRRLDGERQSCLPVACMETLEPRLLMSAWTFSPQGVWTIYGDQAPSQKNDVIVIQQDASDAGLYHAIVNGQIVDSRRGEDITTLRVYGGRGNDEITMDVIEATLFRTVLCGGRGNDIIRGGAGNETLLGQAGRDNLDGGAGDDVVRGGWGADILRGGDGADYIRGGWGKDLIYSDELDRVVGRSADVLAGDTGMNDLDSADPDELRDWLIEAAVSRHQYWFGSKPWNWWFSHGPKWYGIDDFGVVRAFTANEAGQPVSLDSVGSPDYSQTNNQVEGVDEGDLVKTDGEHIYYLSGQELIVVDALPADELAVASRTGITGSAVGLHLVGDQLIVLSQEWDWRWMYSPFTPFIPRAEIDGDLQMVMPMRHRSEPTYTVTIYDVSDPANPVVQEQTTGQGQIVSSRTIDDRLYVVTQDSQWAPELLLVSDEVYGGQRYETEAEYRQRLMETWDAAIGQFTVTAGAGENAEEHAGSVLEGAVYKTDDGVGDHMISVVLFDLDDGEAGPDATTTTLGLGGTVYASQDSLYLAANTWEGGEEYTPTTFIYKFGLGGDEMPLLGTGSVVGSILNQFSMDEHNGVLRIATTSLRKGTWGNNVFTLAGIDGRLDTIGSLTGLARNERIQSVRFMGDQGYLVTFRQVDPLFTLDLSKATNPHVVGELKIPGFSTYLHPMGSDFLIGIGQGENPGTVQVSLFDVSDLANPTRVDAYSFDTGGWSWSQAMWDHHAFSFFAEQGVLAIPVWQSNWMSSGGYRSSADLQVLHVDENGFSYMGSISHDDQIVRSLRIGQNIYTISAGVIRASSISDLSEVGSVLVN